MTKNVTAIGGPADGKVFEIQDGINTLCVAYLDPDWKLEPEENLFAEVIGQDEYGLIFKSHVKQAKYTIKGEYATFEA